MRMTSPIIDTQVELAKIGSLNVKVCHMQTDLRFLADASPEPCRLRSSQMKSTAGPGGFFSLEPVAIDEQCLEPVLKAVRNYADNFCFLSAYDPVRNPYPDTSAADFLCSSVP